MTRMFYTILNMSTIASGLILGIIVLRMIFPRMPKKYMYFLWAVPAARLVFHFSFDSYISLLNFANVPGHLLLSKKTSYANVSTVDLYHLSKTPLSYSDIFAIIWIVGMVFFAVFFLTNYIMTKRRTMLAVCIYDNIYETDDPAAPYTFGFFKRKIYLPRGFDFDQKASILEHEKIHVKRFDCLVALIGVFLKIIYWFNPLVWIACKLMCQDQEMSCDEAVLKNYSNMKYVTEMLEHITGKSIETLAAGIRTSNLKKRIYNILNYKKEKASVRVFGILLCIVIVISGCTNPFTREIALDEIIPVVSETYLTDDGAEIEYGSQSTEELVREFAYNHLITCKGFYYPNEGIPFYSAVRTESKLFDEIVRRSDIIRVLEKVKATEAEDGCLGSIAEELLEIYYNANNQKNR